MSNTKGNIMAISAKEAAFQSWKYFLQQFFDLPQEYQKAILVEIVAAELFERRMDSKKIWKLLLEGVKKQGDENQIALFDISRLNN
jgi:hypothetical protein